MSIDNTRVDEPNVIQLQGVVTSYENHLRRTILLMAAFVLITALAGYGLNLIWTGFRGNMLWDWFKLLFAPVGLATLSIFFGFKRTWRREWIMALVATIVIFLVVIAGGYLFHWPGTGFAGNTLWDWLKLLLLPVSLIIASFSFKGYERVWMTISAVITTFLLVAVVGGYAFHWTWTGFAGNTLWNWLELLLLPLALTVAEPLFSTYRDEGVSIATISGVFLLMAAIGGYAFHWTWTGFQNNTLWDWLTLLILPVALVAARISYHPSKDLAANPATGAQHAAGAPATVEPTLSTRVEQVLPVGAEQTLLVNVEQTKSAPVALPQMVEPPIPSERRRRGWRLFTIAAVLLILFISIAGIVVSAHSGSDLSSARTNPTGNTSQTVGTATFFSTPAQQHEPGGMNDGLRLQLQNISAPSYGNLYYAWLQNSQSTPLTIALGTLTVRNGTVSLSLCRSSPLRLARVYQHPADYRGGSGWYRDSPTLDKQQWRYYGALPQTAASAGQTGFLDNLRHLLSDEPTLEQWGLRGGADCGFSTILSRYRQQPSSSEIINTSMPSANNWSIFCIILMANARPMISCQHQDHRHLRMRQSLMIPVPACSIARKHQERMAS